MAGHASYLRGLKDYYRLHKVVYHHHEATRSYHGKATRFRTLNAHTVWYLLRYALKKIPGHLHATQEHTDYTTVNWYVRLEYANGLRYHGNCGVLLVVVYMFVQSIVIL